MNFFESLTRFLQGSALVIAMTFLIVGPLPVLNASEDASEDAPNSLAPYFAPLHPGTGIVIAYPDTYCAGEPSYFINGSEFTKELMSNPNADSLYNSYRFLSEDGYGPCYVIEWEVEVDQNPGDRGGGGGGGGRRDDDNNPLTQEE